VVFYATNVEVQLKDRSAMLKKMTILNFLLEVKLCTEEEG